MQIGKAARNNRSHIKSRLKMEPKEVTKQCTNKDHHQSVLRRSCSHMLDPPHSLHSLLRRLWGHMLDPRHSLHVLLSRLCSHICDPPQSLHLLLRRPCSHFFDGIPIEMVCLVSTSACSWSFSQRLRVFRDVDQASRPMLLWTSKDSH